MEKKSRQPPASSPQVSARYFSVARSDATAEQAKNPTGITIQIRLKSDAPSKLMTRRNTEFWLSATEE